MLYGPNSAARWQFNARTSGRTRMNIEVVGILCTLLPLFRSGVPEKGNDNRVTELCV